MQEKVANYSVNIFIGSTILDISDGGRVYSVIPSDNYPRTGIGSNRTNLFMSESTAGLVVSDQSFTSRGSMPLAEEGILRVVTPAEVVSLIVELIPIDMVYNRAGGVLRDECEGYKAMDCPGVRFTALGENNYKITSAIQSRSQKMPLALKTINMTRRIHYIVRKTSYELRVVVIVRNFHKEGGFPP